MNTNNALTAKHVIEIPAGSGFVLAANIPNWIAERLVPIPEVLPVLCNLVKRTLIEKNHWRQDELTAADWALLNEIWRGMPHVRDADAEKFQAYRQAFDDVPNKPDWELHAEFKDLKGEAKIRRINIRHRHFWDIDAAAKSGEIKLLTADRWPANRIEPDCIVSVDDARRYLEPRGFELREVEQDAPACDHTSESASLSDAENSDDWRVKARELAQEIGERKWRTGQREITARNMADPVATELSKNRRYFGTRGPRSASNIRNEALKGWQFLPPEEPA